MEVVEVSPPYDVNDNTAQLAARVILGSPGTLVAHGHLGHRNGGNEMREWAIYYSLHHA